MLTYSKRLFLKLQQDKRWRAFNNHRSYQVIFTSYSYLVTCSRTYQSSFETFIHLWSFLMSIYLCSRALYLRSGWRYLPSRDAGNNERWLSKCTCSWAAFCRERILMCVSLLHAARFMLTQLKVASAEDVKLVEFPYIYQDINVASRFVKLPKFKLETIFTATTRLWGMGGTLPFPYNEEGLMHFYVLLFSPAF